MAQRKLSKVLREISVVHEAIRDGDGANRVIGIATAHIRFSMTDPPRTLCHPLGLDLSKNTTDRGWECDREMP